MAYRKIPALNYKITFRTCITNEIDLLKKLDIEKHKALSFTH